jgi:hypothetical protein
VDLYLHLTFQILALLDILKQYMNPIRLEKLIVVVQQEHMVLLVAKILLTLALMVSHNMRLQINVYHRIILFDVHGEFLI